MDKSAVVEALIRNLSFRNIQSFYVDNITLAIEHVLKLIPPNATVGIGNSQTIKKAKISDILNNRGNIVYDKTLAKTKDDAQTIKKKALLTDWYITGTNAISMEGHIVNIDHSGNRVAAMTFGPDHVLVIIGVNKIEHTLEKAIARARNIAVPLNAQRAGFNPPCLELKKCVDCRSKDRVCFNLVIIEGQCDPERMTVLIVDEELGF